MLQTDFEFTLPRGSIEHYLDAQVDAFARVQPEERLCRFAADVLKLA